MSGVDVKTVDFEKLERQLKALSGSVQTKGVRAGLVYAIKPVKDRAKQLAPVNSGALRESIGHLSLSKSAKSRLGLVSTAHTALVVGPTKKVLDESGKKRSQAYKYWFMEFGTSPAVIKPRKRKRNKYTGAPLAGPDKKAILVGGKPYGRANHPGVKANPFLARSLEAHDDQMPDRFWQGVEKYLIKINK